MQKARREPMLGRALTNPWYHLAWQLRDLQSTRLIFTGCPLETDTERNRSCRHTLDVRPEITGGYRRRLLDRHDALCTGCQRWSRVAVRRNSNSPNLRVASIRHTIPDSHSPWLAALCTESTGPSRRSTTCIVASIEALHCRRQVRAVPLLRNEYLGGAVHTFAD